MNVCIPIDEALGLDSPVCQHFGGAPMLLLVNAEDRTFQVLRKTHEAHEHGRCSPLSALAGQQVDAMIVGGIGSGAIAHLEAAGISVYLAEHLKASDNLNALAKGQLQLVGGGGTCSHHDRDSSHGGGHGCCGHG